MQLKITKPTGEQILKYGRRSFVRKVALTAGGAALCLPNLLTNRLYAGTALIVDSSGDKRIELTNAALARAFDIGEWTTLRLGLRFVNNGTGDLGAVTPRFIVGLQSGESDLVLDGSTNFLGTRTTDASWSYNSSGWDAYRITTSYSKCVSTSWTTLTTVSSSYPAPYYYSSNGEIGTGCCMMIIEFSKGSPNWTLLGLFPYGSTGYAVSRAELLVHMTELSLTAPTGHVIGTSRSVAFDEVAGVLDHVAIGWDRPEFGFQISDIAISKIVT